MILCSAGVKKKKGNEEMITGEVMVGDTPRLYGALLRGKKKERERKKSQELFPIESSRNATTRADIFGGSC